MESFRLSTDSTCDLYQSFIREHDIDFVPLQFMIEYKDGKIEECVDKFETPEEYGAFYGKLRNGGYSRTAMLNYEAHYNHFKKIAESGAKDVVHFTISSGLSPTVTVANKAWNDLKKEFPDFSVYAVDSLAATIGQGTLVKMALKCRDEGMSARDTYDYVMGMRLKWSCCIIPNDLFYLQKGGRVSKGSAVAGTMLNIKPVLTFDGEGKLKTIEKARGMRKAFSYAIKRMQQKPLAEEPYVTIVHTDNAEGAQEFSEEIEKNSGIKAEIVCMGPVIGSHVGPGSVSVGWVSTADRTEL